MNDDDKMLVELLRLDGYEVVIRPLHTVMSITVSRKDKGCCTGIASSNRIMLELVKQPNYFESRDAIIPVIEKVINTMHLKWKFITFLSDDNQLELTEAYSDMFELLLQHPKKLCIALLKATGKWVAA